MASEALYTWQQVVVNRQGADSVFTQQYQVRYTVVRPMIYVICLEYLTKLPKGTQMIVYAINSGRTA
jgi:hypothetical protein